MAGKNGKKGVDGNAEEVEDKAIPTPETPKAEVTAAAEPQKPNATPEGEDTYTSQQLFGQKTYDEQMKVENKFAGLNRTDEISQLGGASKLEVDLAQMKVFSTERIGDDLYAAILRGDTEKVESMAGLNSDRRLTEAQILVLLKAKHEQEEEKAKKLAEDAYFAQEIEKQEEASEAADAERAEYLADQLAYNQNVGAGEPDYSLVGYNNDGSYNDPYGGRYNNDNTYTDPDGNTTYSDGRTFDSEGNWASADGTSSYDYDTSTYEIVTPATPASIDAEGNPVPAQPEQRTSIKIDTGGGADLDAAAADGAALNINTARNNGNAPAPLETPEQAAARIEQERLAAANGQQVTTGSTNGGTTTTPRTTSTTTSTGVSTEGKTPLQRAAIVNGQRVNIPTAPGDMSAGQQAKNITASQELARAARSISDDEAQRYIQWTKDARRTSGKLTATGHGEDARTGLGLDDYVQMRLNDKTDTKLSPEARVIYEQQLEKLQALRVENAADVKKTSGLNTSVQIVDKPQAPQAPAVLNNAAANLAAQTIIPEPNANAQPTAPVSSINTGNLSITDNSTPVAAAQTTGLYDEYGGYRDDTGYYDEFGGYYDADGGYYDGMGGYYAKDGGFHDKDGGYTWPDGAYADKYGNYVDAKGDLYAADGTVMKAADHKLGDGEDMGFKKLLQEAAQGQKIRGSETGERLPAVNMFDPASPPSQEKQDAFLATVPKWWNKTEEQRNEWKASNASSSKYAMADASSTYFDSGAYMFDAPIYDPLTKTYTDGGLTGPGISQPTMVA
ncbi:MAG: hypothetical protein ACAH80_12550 [Alphaproteobacteria bacterium]